VVDVEVAYGEGGKGAGGDYHVWWNGAGVVGTPLSGVGIDNSETSRGEIKVTVRVKQVKCHNIAPSEEPR